MEKPIKPKLLYKLCLLLFYHQFQKKNSLRQVTVSKTYYHQFPRSQILILESPKLLKISVSPLKLIVVLEEFPKISLKAYKRPRLQTLEVKYLPKQQSYSQNKRTAFLSVVFQIYREEFFSKSNRFRPFQIKEGHCSKPTNQIQK